MICSYYTFVFIPKQCVIHSRKSFTPDILDHTWYGIHTIWVHVFTQVVRDHTGNKFIHTEIEQFIPCGKNITLNLVSSNYNLDTWRCIMTSATHTNDTDTHDLSRHGQTRHLCYFLLYPPHYPTGLQWWHTGESPREVPHTVTYTCHLDKHDTCATSSYTPRLTNSSGVVHTSISRALDSATCALLAYFIQKYERFIPVHTRIARKNKQ